VLPDDSLDAVLRDVAVPPNLAARIRSALVPSDDDLDVGLRAVVVPESLAARLYDIPEDERLDEALADVASPLTLAPAIRLRRPIDRLRHLGRQAARLALAALWFVAVSAALAAGMLALVVAIYPPPPEEGELVVLYDGPLSVAAEQAASQPSTIIYTPTDESGDTYDRPSLDTHSARFASLAIDGPQFGELPHYGEVAQWVSLVGSGLRPLDDAVLMRFGILGSPQYADDRLPEMDLPLLPAARGIEPPTVRGYDRAFFQKHRIFPPISPGASPQLARVSVPLVTDSDVLWRLARAVEEDRRLPANELRVEDFLAAMNFRLAPAPAGRAAIRTAAGPSPLGAAGASLLQVGVQTGSLADRPQQSTHLVLAIDLSSSMSWSGRLAMVQQGIDRLLDQLDDNDRLSLVVFHEQVVHQVELATKDDAPAIRDLLAALAPRGGTNLAAGIQHAASLAMLDGLPGGGAKRLVLITDSQAHLPPATLARLQGLLAVARDAGVRLDVIDLSDRGAVDPVLHQWAQNTGGDVRPVNTSRQLACSLTEALAGGSPVVAFDAKLTLQFNPRAVAAYRLIGHEANALADVTPVAALADLAAGEAATALVELWLRPGDEDDVGHAELTWRDADGQPQRIGQRISRLQFAPTLAESALSLQQAAVASEIGQSLRGTREALREIGQRPAGGRGLASVLELAGRVHPQVRQRPDLQRILTLARQWEK
jgi:Mg-chelatase subunit ChlD